MYNFFHFFFFMATYCSKPSCFSMASTLFLLLGTFMAILEITGAQSIGVCYGRDGNDLPSPPDVVALYKSKNIGRMRIYDPEPTVLQALRDSNIEVILGVPNPSLQSLANDASAANSWVQTNVRNNLPNIKFKYIAVGNEVSPGNENAQYVNFLLPAMRNIQNALVTAGLQNQIKVSTALYNGMVDPSYPPSQGAFSGQVQGFIKPIIEYIASIGSPALFNVYPYFAHAGNPASVPLPYALFTNPGVQFNDQGRDYRNLFDAIVDACYAALEKAGGPNLNIVVSESGWPSAGGVAATTENARTYNQNLINHVKQGTPKKPGALETYIFAMFNENLKGGAETEKHFGLFLPSREPAYPITFS